MVSRRRFIVLASTGVLALGGAAVGVALLPGQSPKSGPPTLRYGSERCAYCGMLIGDARFAAAWRDSNGREQHFDDIGCMVDSARRADPGAGTERFVHDYGDESWVDAAQATYVRSDRIRTPMSYAVAAFANAQNAATFAQPSDRVEEWSVMISNLKRKG